MPDVIVPVKQPREKTVMKGTRRSAPIGTDDDGAKILAPSAKEESESETMKIEYTENTYV
jgi:hypothetical protein